MDVREFEYLRVGDVRDAARDAGVAWPILACDDGPTEEALGADIKQQTKVTETQPILGRQRQQEEEILRILNAAGYDAKKLPKWTPGKSGVKKEIWEKIGITALFVSAGVFEKAWDRLRKTRDIQEE